MSFEFLFVFRPESDVALMYDDVVFVWHSMPLVCIPNYYVMVRCNDIHLAKASPICASILSGTFEFL